MTYESILYEERDSIAVITLNRPERMNAWTQTMHAELIEAIGKVNDNRNIGAIVVTGAGRGYCAGADMQDTFQSRIDGDSNEAKPVTADWVSFVRNSKPIIAAVNGAAVGVGVTMMLPFDVIIASENARFGLAFVKMGVVPELASSHFLAQRVGFGNASEMCLTGKLYSAQEAYEKGLPNRVVAADELMPVAEEMAKTIAANPALQLGMVKQLLTENACETDLGLVQKREMERLAVAYESAEHKEAVTAFLEKRQPNFNNL
jgi:enoyl-CoA hydratase/carnithine racemase